jgi:addiction module RelE/StbE family toxin
MSYKIVITKKAKQEVLNATMYIANELLSPQAASHLYNTANEAFKSLSEMPKRNSEINPFAIGLSGIRYIVIENYLAFYTVDDDTMTVRIIRFLYSKRDWLCILKTTSFD